MTLPLALALMLILLYQGDCDFEMARAVTIP